jgi:trehalose 6-phosphate synthase
VNQKFADAVVEEMEGTPAPLLLVQDYHFALLPAMVKKARPDARVAVFWHIPWPNPEAFGICPWQAELLEGLLGADLIGFHTQTHCSNFMQTVDRALESRVDYDRKVVNRGEHFTSVRPFPISVNFSRPPVPAVDRYDVLQRLGPRVEFFGIGVDRMDYTKGIPERLHGIERFFEENPAYRERVAFVQIGVPTRTRIKRYQDILTEIRSEAARINKRFGTRDWSPILLLDRHHTHAEIDQYYRHADFCMVTALHDGMNLVAKEYVASREDDTGALILSRFAGAAQELRDALQVNPYDTGELALSIRAALEMSPEEMAARMKQMRQTVRQRNIYWWAAKLVGAAAEIRPAPQVPREQAQVEAVSVAASA